MVEHPGMWVWRGRGSGWERSLPEAGRAGQKPLGAGSTRVLRGLGKRIDYRKAPNDQTSATCRPVAAGEPARLRSAAQPS
ncbi:hypothetical protein EMIT0373P_50345 [Pseudomonas chlororaphis]